MIGRATIATALAVGLAGCATSTFEDLRAAPEGKERIEVAMPYQDAYRILIRESRRCYENAVMKVTGDNFSDRRVAEITVGIQGQLGNKPRLAVDIRELASDRTEVVISSGGTGSSKAVQAMRAWLAGDTSECFR